jgi:hypothetical protein
VNDTTLSRLGAGSLCTAGLSPCAVRFFTTSSGDSFGLISKLSFSQAAAGDVFSSSASWPMRVARKIEPPSRAISTRPTILV